MAHSDKSTARSGPRQRVLIVDDDPAVRDVIGRALERADLEAVMAVTGAEAIAAVAEGRVDLIVLDQQLPDTSGIAVLEQLRSTDAIRRIPVLVITGTGDETLRIAALDGGAVDFMTKPFTVTEIVARIRAQLRQRQVWDERPSGSIGPGTRRSLYDQLAALIAQGGFMPMYQAIVELRTGRIVGFEALTRFADGSNPERRFQEAESVGLGAALEQATMAAAIRGAEGLAGVRLHLNTSPAFAVSDAILPLLRRAGADVVLELTEHDVVPDYAALRVALARRPPGTRLAVDDAGSGYASLRHVLRLQPDYLKLDADWIREVDVDRSRQALIRALVQFSRQTGAELIAEGIEHRPEARVLQELGVPLAQGYLFGYPTADPRAQLGSRPTHITFRGRIANRLNNAAHRR